MITSTDFLVIGGGIIGLTLARELARRYGDSSITLIEKEEELGAHASGRNSGVLHAGFYYTADSLKARFARDGNLAMRTYCLERGLSLNECGKLVVARGEMDLPVMDELLRRAKVNGVELYPVDVEQARQLEPLARTYERALWSPTTASIDANEVLRSIARDAAAAGVRILRSTAYVSHRARKLVKTSSGDISCGFVINVAGLHADSIAHDFGFAGEHRILPFKGLYLHDDRQPPLPLRRHVYPVPELRQPFLGVHFTVSAAGHVKIGPTAIPALWREQYGGLTSFHPGEFAEIVARQCGLWMRNDMQFRTLAMSELRKIRKKHLVVLAAALVPAALDGHFTRWGRPGIRAQLVNVRTRTLEADFHYEGDAHSFHVLNAVSPAFTCALPFSAHLADRIATHVE